VECGTQISTTTLFEGDSVGDSGSVVKSSYVAIKRCRRLGNDKHCITPTILGNSKRLKRSSFWRQGMMCFGWTVGGLELSRKFRSHRMRLLHLERTSTTLETSSGP
jgi:hypothetical protein